MPPDSSLARGVTDTSSSSGRTGSVSFAFVHVALDFSCSMNIWVFELIQPLLGIGTRPIAPSDRTIAQTVKGWPLAQPLLGTETLTYAVPVTAPIWAFVPHSELGRVRRRTGAGREVLHRTLAGAVTHTLADVERVVEVQPVLDHAEEQHEQQRAHQGELDGGGAVLGSSSAAERAVQRRVFGHERVLPWGESEERQIFPAGREI